MLGGRYALTERLGSGAMGEVWRAEDRVLGRQVAVKIVLPALMEDEVFAARFRREATVLAAMSHRGVVHIHDYGEDVSDPSAKIAYIVMELLSGRPLDKAKGRGSFPPDRALDITAQMLDALHAAHQQGIVHRDIKPSNLMIDQDGRVTVTDFGIARTLADTRITTAHAVIGTALYMAPERAEGKDASAASDLYSVGVVLYELLAGKPPFSGETPLEVVLKHVREPVPELPGTVPAPVRAVVARALAKQPGDRYPDAAAMAAAARQAMSTPAGLGAVVALAGPDENPPAVPAPAPVPANANPNAATVPARAERGGRRRLVTLVLPIVLVTGGGVTAQQFDLLPWQHRAESGVAAKSQDPQAGSPSASGSAPSGQASGTVQGSATPPPSSAPPATDQAGNPVPPGGAPAPGANTGNGGTGSGGSTTTGGGSTGTSGGGTGSSGGSNSGGAGGGGGGNANPAQPAPATSKPTANGPAAGCGGSGWGRLVNVGTGQAAGLGSAALSAGVPVVSGSNTSYGWIRSTDGTGVTTFTACKSGSGVSLGARYAGSPNIAELAGASSYGDMTNWYATDAGSGTFQLKFGYGVQSCLTDTGSGSTLAVTTCSPGSTSQLFRFS
ncbi:putative serine/threonine protein kinase [Kitasatospora cheerisanensis KCTC 2395]|uniref:non-specific serine/threonine protein kinase n=1 Tax=Kitasatospora cheerisanensis KCTC 2395 TaxID=1348663 RepID=A0A066Z254_9ACTN|nr:putative serine/threonine protein kinase [Kitasatospora cheerisanensis KCTC 2395]